MLCSWYSCHALGIGTIGKIKRDVRTTRYKKEHETYYKKEHETHYKKEHETYYKKEFEHETCYMEVNT